MKARDNPFATSRVESLLSFDPDWLDTCWDTILSDLKHLNYRAAVTGPHGSGKTTFLDALVPRLHRLGFSTDRYFLNDTIRTRPDPPRRHHRHHRRSGATHILRMAPCQEKLSASHHYPSPPRRSPRSASDENHPANA